MKCQIHHSTLYATKLLDKYTTYLVGKCTSNDKGAYLHVQCVVMRDDKVNSLTYEKCILVAGCDRESRQKLNRGDFGI